MKSKFYTSFRLYVRVIPILLGIALAYKRADAQATYSVPVSIGYPCGNSNGTPKLSQFHYDAATARMRRLAPITCNPSLASPGFSIWAAGVAFNPKDTALYYMRYTGGNSYAYRWKPGDACPPPTALLKTFTGQIVLGLTFDPNGIGYQLIFTGSAPYGLALQRVDFTGSGSFGPVIPVSLPPEIIIMQENGDIVLTPGGQMLAIYDNRYFTINYQDYGINPLVATFIATLPGNDIIGLAYADGKLIGTDVNGSSSSQSYYEIDILSGNRKTISVVDTNGTTNLCYKSNDMTNITTGIGTAKRLSSQTYSGIPGTYDLSYDIYVQNYGDWPLENVQVTEKLNGFGVAPFAGKTITNLTVTLVDNPAGVVLNPSYNGNSNINLLAASQKLPNFPVANNHFTIRVSFRVAGIVAGIVYNNNATATGEGYLLRRVTDQSTNGSVPDLNNNDKADDAGENQPTPFIIPVVAETPPCLALNNILYQQNFGAAVTRSATIPSGVTTEYIGDATGNVGLDSFAIVSNANNGNTARWISLTDFNGGGSMMVVNADVANKIVFQATVNITCTNLQYSFFARVANVANSSYGTFCSAFGGIVNPSLTFRVRDLSNNIITSITTPDITSGSWTQYGMKFVMPSGLTSVRIEILNAAMGGCGNDFALDDIQFGLCDPVPTVNAGATAGCLGSSTTLSGNLSDPNVVAGTVEYQWQIAPTASGIWTNISGATSANYTINNMTLADQQYYRLIVAAAGNINNINCRYISPAFYLPLKDYSVAPAAIQASMNTICLGSQATLTVIGGSLGTNAQWRWYTGSCGGTLIGTGSSIVVAPSTTTTYYVRAEGDCNNTACASTIIVVNNCDILPIDFLQFNAVQYTSSIQLNWRIQTSEALDRFEVERSIDNLNFSRIGQVKKDFSLNTSTALSFLDENLNITATALYYRIKAITREGKVKYSNTLIVRLSTLATDKILVTPNPASSTVSIRLYSPLRGQVEIMLVDITNKVILRKEVNVEAGNNTIALNQLSQYAEGVYTLMLHVNDRWEHERLVIKR